MTDVPTRHGHCHGVQVAFSLAFTREAVGLSPLLMRVHHIWYSRPHSQVCSPASLIREAVEPPHSSRRLVLQPRSRERPSNQPTPMTAMCPHWTPLPHDNQGCPSRVSWFQPQLYAAGLPREPPWSHGLGDLIGSPIVVRNSAVPARELGTHHSGQDVVIRPHQLPP